MRPNFRLTINDTPLPEGVASRLQSLMITDREGVRSDTLDLELADDPEQWLEIPDSRAIIRVWGGYGDDLEAFGAFSDADVELRCLPYSVSISAKAADLKSPLKASQERHWDDATLGSVFSQLARENGLEPRIAASLAERPFPGRWAAMQNESVLAYGARIAERHGALFAVKDGGLILAELGAGTTVSGVEMTPLELTPDVIMTGSCSTRSAARERFASVAAEWQDNETGRRMVEAAESAGGAAAGEEVRQVLRHGFGDAEEARHAAEARARQLTASADRMNLTIEGDPRARGGLPIVLQGVRPGIDGKIWIIESATHRFSKSGGYSTAISAKIKP